ncbi:MAG: ThiF family adenylyltransferase [Candidatus Doudnabacteria bacterium]
MLEPPRIFKDKKDAPANAKVIDAFSSSLTELFFIAHPHLKKGMPEVDAELQKYLEANTIPDIWIYYPETNTLVRTLPEEEYFRLRTARNRDLISEQEQNNFRSITVGIAGLSVGSSVLNILVLSGGPKVLKIADFDTLEVSNLNRIRAGLADVGTNKTEIAAREVWELDPFAQLKLYHDGLNKENIEEFILGEPRLGVFVDAMDSIDLKILARLICKKNKIPVLSATDNGDSVILDIERFDLEPGREIFHGLVKDIEQLDLDHLDYKSWLNLAAQIVGPEYLTESMQDSVLKIGKSLASVPQLGASAAIGGSACSFAIRRIANKQALNSGRSIISLEEKLIPGFGDPESVLSRSTKTEQFVRSFGQK